MQSSPIFVVAAVIVVLLGLIGMGRKFARCLWYMVAPIVFVVACVLLYNWFLKP